MKKFLLTPALAVMLTSLLGVDTMARPNVPTGPNNSGGKTAGTSFSKLQALCTAGTSKAELDINNVRAMVLNGGDMWWDLSDPRYEVPKVDDPSAIKKHSLFAGAVWIGGTEAGGGGNLHLAAQTFRQGSPPDVGFWPGPLDANGSVDDAICRAFDFHAKINADIIEDFKLKNFPVDQNDIPQAILNWPGKGNPFRADISSMGAGELAPFEDVDDDQVYDPRQGDYPKIKGNQAIWWVMNDAGGVKVPASPTIGLELQVLAFAFESSDLVNNMTFYEQTMINRGNKVLNNTYLAQWVDPDLGNYLDDYVGCDVNRGLGYVFNGDEFDEGVSGYGENPPALGVDFFAGPRSDPFDGLDNDRDGIIDETDAVVDCETGETQMLTEEIIMSNFIYFNNNSSPINGNPDQDTDYYNYMQSKWGNGNPVYYGGDGVTPAAAPFDKQYKFMFPGDTDPLGYGYHQPLNPIPGVPTDYTPNPMPNFAWTERQAGNEPADRRFIQSAGPFTLSPGQVLPLTIGVVWVRPSSGGVTSSLSLLGVADDAAQALFNNCFEQAIGPPAPDMAITELDRELIISLIPSKFVQDGEEVNTEDFLQLDRTYQGNPAVQDPYYRFQGYIVYQLRNPRVTVTDLDNPNLARIVAAENGSGQSDIQDNLGQLVNREFDPELTEYTSVIEVKGENKGIRHTLRVQRDMFAQGDARLVNYKTYHYMVIAYASNPFNDVNEFDNYRQYRAGRGNVRTYSAIPHKVAPESGMVLNASPGDELPVTRLFGVGNGENVLDLAAGEEDSILTDVNSSQRYLNYAAGGSPVAIKVYDPKRVARANFNLKLSSRLAFFADETNGTISFHPDTDEIQGLSVGDTIVAGPLATLTSPDRLQAFPQIPGRARINRIVSTDPRGDDPLDRRLVVLDLEMLNDEFGGTFTTEVEDRTTLINPDDGSATEILNGYLSLPMDWSKLNGGASGKTFQYGLHEFWRLNIDRENGSDTTVFSNRTLSDFDEQLLPDYGLAIQLRRSFNPSYQVDILRENQFQEASLEFEGGVEWLEPVSNDDVPWLLPGPTASNPGSIADIDPGTAYQRVLQGSWAPYEEGTQVSVGGPAYFYPNAPRRIYDLPNVNVVFTPDQNKWSKVVVLQADLYENCGLAPTSSSVPVHLQKLLKSARPSIDRNGNPVTQLSPFQGLQEPLNSTGMGWFPGYAIDLDRGVRLNLMFSESRLSDTLNGNNLLYDPTTDPNGGKSFIYVTNTIYDEGRALEYSYDSLMTAPAYVSTATTGTNVGCLNRSPQNFGNQIKLLFDAVTWVGNMKLTDGAQPLANKATVRLRVNRQYNSYSPIGTNPNGNVNDNPEYAFSTNGAAVSVNNVEVAKSALDLVRVVPNPYYAYSDYEQRVTDNIVKITNLPPRAQISIFNLNGTLVQTLRKDDPSTTFIDWNLKNRDNLSISSGVYIIHVKAELRDKSGNLNEEEKVVKFFAILRPIDLQSF